jgi:hypothetical protein
MKAQIRVRVFREFHNHLVLEDTINAWIEAEGLGPADILKIAQSESACENVNILTISVWYIPRPVEPERPERTWVERIKDEVPF